MENFKIETDSDGVAPRHLRCAGPFDEHDHGRGDA